MLVFARSYGTRSMIENRGPQLVQLMKGYRHRRSPGVNSSRLQSSQMTISGEISALGSPLLLLRMTNPC